MKAGNKQELSLVLRNYKKPNGAVDFPVLFEIKTENRLPELAKKDYTEMLSILSVGLTLSFEAMNLSRSMSDTQILDLAETILDSSHEDNLALEDVMLFLQKLIRGEYGKLYESMDIPKFMEFFEGYREARWQALLQLREEQNIQHKALPINDRILTLRDLLSLNKKSDEE